MKFPLFKEKYCLYYYRGKFFGSYKDFQVKLIGTFGTPQVLIGRHNQKTCQMYYRNSVDYGYTFIWRPPN